MSAAFDQKIRTTLADSRLQLAIYTATGRLMEKRRELLFEQYVVAMLREAKKLGIEEEQVIAMIQKGAKVP